jgi:ABC-2 type transport system ATP-binding protein
MNTRNEDLASTMPRGTSGNATPPLAVDVVGLRKSFGASESRTDALVGVDFQVRFGEIVGVLGPNGAGKTTMMSILEGLVVADAGTALVLGENVNHRGALKRIKQRMGVSMQHSVLPPLLTVSELLEFLRVLYKKGREPDQLIEILGLDEKRDVQTRYLSGGQQQRVTVALALIGDPDLVFLDEPTSQLDPQARRVVWDLLLEQRERSQGAVLVTTHQMEEAERLCDRVVILDHGQILAQGTPRELIERYCPERVLEFHAGPQTDFSFLDQAVSTMPTSHGQIRVQIRPKHLDHTLLALMTKQDRGELLLKDLRIDGQTLEDVFLKLTGREIR